jgi:hypothetical protein
VFLGDEVEPGADPMQAADEIAEAEQPAGAEGRAGRRGAVESDDQQRNRKAGATAKPESAPARQGVHFVNRFTQAFSSFLLAPTRPWGRADVITFCSCFRLTIRN